MEKHKKVNEVLFIDLYEVLKNSRLEPCITIETIAQIINSIFSPEEREQIKKNIK
jgi:hypothetical protein